MQRFVINLYFGDWDRVWCFYTAPSREEAEEFANNWADQYCPGPSIITVYATP